MIHRSVWNSHLIILFQSICKVKALSLGYNRHLNNTMKVKPLLVHFFFTVHNLRKCHKSIHVKKIVTSGHNIHKTGTFITIILINKSTLTQKRKKEEEGRQHLKPLTVVTKRWYPNGLIGYVWLRGAKKEPSFDFNILILVETRACPGLQSCHLMVSSIPDLQMSLYFGKQAWLWSTRLN